MFDSLEESIQQHLVFKEELFKSWWHLACIIYLSMYRARSAQTATLNVSKFQPMYRYKKSSLNIYQKHTSSESLQQNQADVCWAAVLQHKMSQLEIFTSSLAPRLGALWRSWGFAPSQHQPVSSLNITSAEWQWEFQGNYWLLIWWQQKVYQGDIAQ